MGDTQLNTELEDDLESLLSCPICMDDYRDPRMLPCQHSFCESCLTKYIKDTAKINNDTGIKTFRCPMCRCKTKQRNNQDLESGFPMNKTIHELLESKEKMIEENGLSSDTTDDNNDEVENKRDNEGNTDTSGHPGGQCHSKFAFSVLIDKVTHCKYITFVRPHFKHYQT